MMARPPITSRFRSNLKPFKPRKTLKSFYPLTNVRKSAVNLRKISQSTGSLRVFAKEHNIWLPLIPPFTFLYRDLLLVLY